MKVGKDSWPRLVPRGEFMYGDQLKQARDRAVKVFEKSKKDVVKEHYYSTIISVKNVKPYTVKIEGTWITACDDVVRDLLDQRAREIRI